MLSTVLRSKRAIAVNVEIMRTFARLRQILNSNADLAQGKLESAFDRSNGNNSPIVVIEVVITQRRAKLRWKMRITERNQLG